MPVEILKASHLFSPKDWLGTPVCLSLQEVDAADYKWKSLAKVYPYLLRGYEVPWPWRASRNLRVTMELWSCSKVAMPILSTGL